MVGPHRISRLLVNIASRFMHLTDHDIRFRAGWVNGSPGLIVSVDDVPYWVATMDVEDGRVGRFYAMLNPDKIGGIGRRVDLV